MKQLISIFKFSFLFLVLISSYACNPKYGTIKGYVKDSAGERIEGVVLKISPTDVNQTSDENGEFTFGDLEEGLQYTIYSEKIGYSSEPLAELVVFAGEVKDITITMTKLYLTITSPQSSSNWQVGTQQTITWNTPNVGDKVKIELWKGNSIATTIEQSTEDDGTHIWPSIPTNLTAGSDYKIRITNIEDASIYDESDNFSIYVVPAPIATTTAQSDLTSNSVTLKGTVNPNGQQTTVTFLWGTSESALVNEDDATPNIIQGTAGTTNVTCPISNLSSGNTYYYKVKAVSAGGTHEGSVLHFTTSSQQAPTATTLAATSISPNSATLNGAVVANGLVTTAIFEYGKTTAYGYTTPQINIPAGTTSTPLTANISGIDAGTLYYFRVVATNSAGTTTATNLTFTTSTAGAPAVTTLSESNVTYNSAYFGGNITSLGQGATQVTQYGHVWSVTSENNNPTFANCDNKTQLGTVNHTGTYTSFMTNLESSQTYTVKAYCTNNGVDYVYGTAKTFTTSMPNPPNNVTTYQATDITQVTAGVSGMINSFPVGINNASAYGFCWAETQNPTTSNSFHSLGATSTIGEIFNYTITGLTSNKTYYVRAYVTTTAGTIYGNQISFTTATKK